MSEPSPELNDSTDFTRRFLRLCYTQEFLGGRAKDATKDAVKNGNFLALLAFCCSGTRSSQGTCILQGKRNCSGVDHTNNHYSKHGLGADFLRTFHVLAIIIWEVSSAETPI